MSDFSIIRAFKEAKTLIHFSYGESVNVYATTWKSPVFFKGNEHRPEPGIEISLPKQSGGINEEPCNIILPLTRSSVHPELHAMAMEIYSPRAVPRTQVRIYQQIQAGSEQRIAYLYEGLMERSISNPGGRTGVVELSFASELTYGLDKISLGRRCDPECDVRFGGAGCLHPAGSRFQVANSLQYYPNQIPSSPGGVRSMWVIAVIDPQNPRKLTVSLDPAVHPTPNPAPPAGFRTLTISEMEEGYWIGSFFIDIESGLSIPIQTWEQGTAEFILSQLPPKIWDGKSLLLKVDCAKTRKACEQRHWSDKFNGLGYGIPDYNPAIDVPNS